MKSDIVQIWNDFNLKLKAFIVNKVKDESLADDILQEVFIKIMNNINKVSQSENMQHYIFAMARNAIYDHFRSTEPHFDYKENIPDLSEEETTSLNTTIADCCIKPFINKLPERYKEALLKTEFEDVSQKELAQTLGISYSGAKSRVQRGKEKLKGLILDCCAFQSDIYGNLQEVKNKKCDC